MTTRNPFDQLMSGIGLKTDDELRRAKREMMRFQAAAMAMQGLLSRYNFSAGTPTECARYAVESADALILELQK